MKRGKREETSERSGIERCSMYSIVYGADRRFGRGCSVGRSFSVWPVRGEDGYPISDAAGAAGCRWKAGQWPGLPSFGVFVL